VVTWILPFAFALGTGIMSAWGVGGGTLLLVCMTLFLGVEHRTAQAVNLLFFLPTAGAGLYFHRKNGFLDKDAWKQAALPGAAASLAASLLAAAVDVSAVLTLRVGYTVEQMQPLVEAAVGEYLLGVRKQWAEPDADRLTSYSCWVYLARVVSAILSVPGVVNAVAVTLNGDAADLQLIETGELQQAPVLGEVALRAGD